MTRVIISRYTKLLKKDSDTTDRSSSLLSIFCNTLYISKTSALVSNWLHIWHMVFCVGSLWTCTAVEKQRRPRWILHPPVDEGAVGGPLRILRRDINKELTYRQNHWDPYGSLHPSFTTIKAWSYCWTHLTSTSGHPPWLHGYVKIYSFSLTEWSISQISALPEESG